MNKYRQATIRSNVPSIKKILPFITKKSFAGTFFIYTKIMHDNTIAMIGVMMLYPNNETSFV